jgi:methyl-accepting chemotaxis protein
MNNVVRLSVPECSAGGNADSNTMNAVARDCGRLAVECSDVSGYVAGVAERVGSNLRTLDDLEAVSGELLKDQERVAGSAEQARRLTERALDSLLKGAAEIGHSVQDFGELVELVVRLGDRMASFARAMEQVEAVSDTIESIAARTNMLALNATIEAARAGTAGRSFVVVAAEVKKLAQETRLATGEITRTIESLTQESELVANEIRAGVARSEQARSGFRTITGTIDQVAELVTSLDERSIDVARSASQIQLSVEGVKRCLDSFAGDARTNGGQLAEAQVRLANLETVSGTMLTRLAKCGVRIDDSSFVDLAEAANKEIENLIEDAIARGEISLEAVFDTRYEPIAGTNPPQYWNRFCEFADRRIRPVLDRVTSLNSLHVGCVISDINGYLPTHISRRSHPQSKDPVWNAEHSRNRCNFIDDALRRAIANEDGAMLVTYRMDFGNGRYLPVKNVFVPTFINDCRWGNFELAYRDENEA